MHLRQQLLVAGARGWLSPAAWQRSSTGRQLRSTAARTATLPRTQPWLRHPSLRDFGTLAEAAAPSRPLSSKMLAAAAAAAGGALTLSFLDTLIPSRRSTKGAATCSNDSGNDELTEEERRTIDLFTSSSKSVVFVTNEVALRGRALRFGGGSSHAVQGTGSGWVWDDEGHIITNCHVIKHASKILITTADQETFECKVVGKDESRDVAVLKVKSNDGVARLKPLALAESSKLSVGQKALAIGNPYGLDFTLTTGVVSALGRELDVPNRRPFINMIQTDAAMNPGSSGGPLLNSAGKVIGMNTVIYSQSGASAGVGFAIPIDTLKAVARQLIKHGHAATPGIGVTLLPDEFSTRFGINGVVIATAETSASKEQFKESYRDSSGNIHFGDIITRIDKTPINTSADVYRAFANVSVGDWVQVEYDRLTGRRRGRAMEVEQHQARMRAVDVMASRSRL